MPITASAKKALRQNKTRRAQNAIKRDAYRSAARAYIKSLGEKDKKKSQTLLDKTYRALDKATKTDAIKKNKASRLKSRLAKKFSNK